MRSIKDTTGGPVWQWTYQTSGSITSSPAIGPDPSDSSRWVVYFGSADKKVYAVYGSAPLATSATWPMFRRNPTHTASEATSTTCNAPYWITPHDGDSYSVSYCNCVLLQVHALAGTQIDFYDTDSFPTHLNVGTAGSDNTFSYNFCYPTDGSHHLYFEASAGGHVISSQCNPIQIDTSRYTDPTCVVTGRIAAGLLHSLALKYDGTVWAWGDNTYGQLGINNNNDSATPVQVLILNNIVAIAAGWTHNLALQSDGTVWAWGRNNFGQLGINNSHADQKIPIPVPGLSGVMYIAAGAYHSLARTSGDFLAWGYNADGELGVEDYAQRDVPTHVSNTSGLWYYNVTAIAAGAYHSLAIGGGGQVWAWGANNRGQLGLGNGTTSPKNTPQQISVGGFPGVKAIAGGLYHSLAIDNDPGYVWAWGDNTYGQLGSGNPPVAYNATPAHYWSSYGVQAISAGVAHSLAIDSSGSVWSWGYNDHGQLGDNSTTTRSTPVQVGSGLPSMTTISGGGHFSLSAGSPTAIYSWGANSDGQLGNGNAPTDSLIPTTVSGFNF